jgi:hypothetical protein
LTTVPKVFLLTLPYLRSTTSTTTFTSRPPTMPLDSKCVLREMPSSTHAPLVF